ncbi:hypothetical protein HPB51_011096 [Rhipicephalus microplus]|uniref:POLQ-like helical domain-containing protein n=1 Tax=Rhipicephalus microplus TaxID=6941 RepID=A0A9J6DU68_RHIMP|nr:hypothetical protein HPB51_011096 [Rhipicephalus microplus]
MSIIALVQIGEQQLLQGFYKTMQLNDLWHQKSVWEVAAKYKEHRGQVQTLLASASTFASALTHFCKGRARQLHKAGFRSIMDVACADPKELAEKVGPISRRQSRQIVDAAKASALNSGTKLVTVEESRGSSGASRASSSRNGVMKEGTQPSRRKAVQSAATKPLPLGRVQKKFHTGRHSLRGLRRRGDRFESPAPSSPS